MDNGFQGKEGQQVPEMTDEIVTSISERYIELYEQTSGQPFSGRGVLFRTGGTFGRRFSRG